jgi:drug/metabolite transporter (DMT)-like permease
MPMSTRPIPTLTDFLLLLLLALAWGSAFALIKLAVATVPPITIVLGRLIVALAVVLGFLAATRQSLPRNPRDWRVFAAVALLGNVVPFALVAWSEIHVDTAIAAILMATTPIFTVVLAHFFTADERLSLRALAGVLSGFAGVVLLLDVPASGTAGGPGGSADLLAGAALVLATLSYAATNVVARRATQADSPAAASAAALICAVAWAAPASMVVDVPWLLEPTPLSVVAVVALGVWCTALPYILYFRIIRSAGATFVSQVNYLIPVIGVAFGVAAFGETPTWRDGIALSLILGGIAATRQARRSG